MLLTKAMPQDRSFALPGRMPGSRHARPAFCVVAGTEKGNADAEKGGAETEQDELSVPPSGNCLGLQVHEQQRRQKVP